MNFILLSFLTLLLFLSSCSHHRNNAHDDTLISMQMIDRNGLTETISSKERLAVYERINYQSPQPYQKILRVFSKNHEGKNPSKITSYHPNGQLWQYLEALDGRAHGLYREWFANGKPRIEVEVIEGTADINELAQNSWIFDGIAKVYIETGVLEAEIPYDKGLLSGIGRYYYEDGTLERTVPYEKGLVHGEVLVYTKNGAIKEKLHYIEGKKDGLSEGHYSSGSLAYHEEYKNSLLINATYYAENQEILGKIEKGNGIQLVFEQDAILSKITIQEGEINGKIELFNPDGSLAKYYHAKGPIKHGEEMVFYPQKIPGTPDKPKISFQWQDDILHGLVKTWYESGALESQRELCGNKKQGLSFAWYENGDMMLMEEYENDKLTKGSYFKKGSKKPISTIENGNGLATLYDKNGIFLKKITYESGIPLLDAE